MKLSEAEKLILQREIKIPEYNSEKFKDDNEKSALTKILGKSQEAALAAFQLVKSASENFRLNDGERIPL